MIATRRTSATIGLDHGDHPMNANPPDPSISLDAAEHLRLEQARTALVEELLGRAVHLLAGYDEERTLAVRHAFVLALQLDEAERTALHGYLSGYGYAAASAGAA